MNPELSNNSFIFALLKTGVKSSLKHALRVYGCPIYSKLHTSITDDFYMRVLHQILSPKRTHI